MLKSIGRLLRRARIALKLRVPRFLIPPLKAVKRNKVAIKGPITTPVGTGFRSVNVALRKTLGLYVCLRPVVRFPVLVVVTTTLTW